MHSGQAEQSSMVFGLLRSPFRVVLSALNQKRLVLVGGDALDDAGDFFGRSRARSNARLVWSWRRTTPALLASKVDNI